MKRWHQYVVAAAGVGLIGVVLSMTFARPVSAQSGQPTPLAILTAITSLGTAVQSALSNIQSSLDALTAQGQSNVRVTPAIRISSGGGAVCIVVNVADGPRTVTVQLLSFNGQVLAQSEDTVVEAGDAPAIGLNFTSADRPYCKFTVEDGSRTDIRGSIESNDGKVLSAE